MLRQRAIHRRDRLAIMLESPGVGILHDGELALPFTQGQLQTWQLICDNKVRHAANDAAHYQPLAPTHNYIEVHVYTCMLPALRRTIDSLLHTHMHAWLNKQVCTLQWVCAHIRNLLCVYVDAYTSYTCCVNCHCLEHHFHVCVAVYTIRFLCIPI